MNKSLSTVRFNNVDLAWLRMESPVNPMVITVVLDVKGQINCDHLLSIMKVNLGRYRRFRQRIVIPRRAFSRPYWEDDPDFSVVNQVERVGLRFPTDVAALEELVNIRMNTALDMSRPPWKVTLVENYPTGDLLICRFHHCIGDGISLMQVLLGMTQTSVELSASVVSPEVVPGQEFRNPGEGASDKLPRSGYQNTPTLNATQSMPVEPPPTYVQSAPLRKPTITEIVAATSRILFRPPDPPTILKRPLGKVKKAVWSEPLSLSEIKQIARSHHATVNDVFMVIVSGAIRRYLNLHNDYRTRKIRAFNLVNLRGREFDEELGNKFGLVFLTLPLSDEKQLDRLEAIKNGMNKLKASAEYAATYIILNILGQLPGWVENLATRYLDTKGTVVATNVPGPKQPIYLAGSLITSIKAWVPQSGRIGVGLSIVSYNDQIFFGLNVDAGLIPDPEQFLDFFLDEFNTFKAAL